jgi:hypothetical protein
MAPAQKSSPDWNQCSISFAPEARKEKDHIEPHTEPHTEPDLSFARSWLSSGAMTMCSRSLRLFVVVGLAYAGCSSNDTVLALTIKSGATIGIVSKIRVTVTPKAGSAVSAEFVPPVDNTPDAGGVISPSFFHRVTIGGDQGGEATVAVEALNANGALFAVGATTADLRSHGATTAAVTLTLGTTLPVPDGGSDAATDAGTLPDVPGSDATGSDASNADGG